MGRTPFCDKSTGLRKGTWTPEEDRKLIDFVTKHGHKNWPQLPKFAGLARCGKSCRLRWMNYLRPGIRRGNYTHEEEETIIKLHARLGNRWSVIASHLTGRSDNEIKNHWHANLKKRIDQYGLTNEKAEASHHSSVESIQEKDSVEVAACHFQNSSLTTFSQTRDASPSSQHTSLNHFFCTITEPAPVNNGNLVIDGIANFLETNIDLISACSWEELYDISYFSVEFLAPFLTESECFCPASNDVWSLSE